MLLIRLVSMLLLPVVCVVVRSAKQFRLLLHRLLPAHTGNVGHGHGGGWLRRVADL